MQTLGYPPVAMLIGVLVAFLLFGIGVWVAARRSRRSANELTAALHADRRRFEAVADTVPDAIISVGAEDRIVYANKAAEQMFDRRVGELIDQPFSALLPERFHRAYHELFRRSASAGEARGGEKAVELAGRRHAGAEFPLEIFLAHGRSSGIGFFTAILRDVSERKSTEKKFRGLLESASDAVVIVDQSGNIVLSNELTEKLFRYARNGLIGQPVEVLIPERFRSRHPHHRGEFFAVPGVRSMAPDRELYGRRTDDSEFPVEINLGPLPTEDGTFAVAWIRDATERKRAEQAMSDSEQLYRRLVENSRVFICSHDMNGVLRYVNSAAATTLGYTPEEMIGKRLSEFLAPDLEGEFLEYLERVRENGRDSGLMAVLSKDHDERVWAYDNVVCQTAREGQYVLGQAQDVTDLRRAQETLKAARDSIHLMATHDGLTRLCNRQLFYEHLSQAIEYTKRYKQVSAILYLDIDRFKRVNDSLGREAGDQLLRSVASILSTNVRKSDVAGRMGGDEFAVLLRNIADRSRAELVARKIAQQLHSPLTLNGEHVVLTASIGIACYPGNGNDPEELVKHAETAMYRAKNGGRNGIKCFAKGMKSSKKK